MTVTHVLIALNVAAWVLNVVTGVDPLSPSPQDLFAWGASHVLANAEQPWRLLSSTFLHVGLLHLAVNMQALWVAGPIADAMLGRWQFLMIYLCAGIFGGLAAMIGAQPTTVLVGASGAVFGTMGAIAAGIFRHGDRLREEVVASLKRLLWSFVAINLLIGFLLPGVSNAAHLGGLLSGFALSCGLAAPGSQPRDTGMRAALMLALALTLMLGLFRWLTDADPIHAIGNLGGANGPGESGR
jgi:rhomboid protease GluP